MGIYAPETHSISEKVTRQANEYVDGLEDLGSIMVADLPAVERTAEAAHHVVSAESDLSARHSAADHLRNLGAGEQTRAIQLARTAIAVAMATDLIHHAQDQSAPPESRRLAIQLAGAVLGRHRRNSNRKKFIAQRYL